MEKVIEWNIENFLSIGESVIYKCDIVEEDEEDEDYIRHLFLTNYRMILMDEEEIGAEINCILFKFIKEYGVFIEFESPECENIGAGKYAVYIGNIDNRKAIWFYSEDAWKEFYDELSRLIVEEG